MKNKRITEMNLVPYIDVMLVLLVIFMITAPMLTNGIAVDLPTLTNSSSIAHEQAVLVSIDNTGKYYFDQATNPKRPIALEKIMQYCQKYPGQAILIKADRRLAYETVVRLLDVLQQQGFRNVGLVTN